MKVSVPLASMKTGISIRDKHMHEKYLQTPNFPSADLQVPRASLKIPAAGGNVAQDAAGTLTLHGKSKPSISTTRARATGRSSRCTARCTST